MELDPDFKIEWPIRQGDLLGFHDWNSRPPLERFGVVITADCDIAQGRADQELVYLKIIPQFDYVSIFWSRTKIERASAKMLNDLSAQVNKLRRAKYATATDLDVTDVEQWLRVAAPGEIADEVCLPTSDEKTRLIENVERTARVTAFADAPEESPCLDRLIEWRAVERQKILQQAVNELRTPPDELFFLTGITQPSDQTGYYVLLDQIGAVRRAAISDSLSDVRQGKKAAYRFGRLTKTFKYAVAQRFAFLFQRIGLPDDHRDRHVSCLLKVGTSA